MSNSYRWTLGITLSLSIGIFVFLYLFTSVFGETRLGVTLRTNTNLDNGLVGHWTFDGSDIDLSSPTAEIIDSSGSGNNGNWVLHASTTEPGRIGQAIRFSNVEDRVTLGGSTNLLRNVGAATMAFWVKQDELTTEEDAIVFDISVGIDTFSRFQLSVGSTTDPNAMVGGRAGDGESFQTVRTSNNPIVAGEWQHVVGVVDYTNDEARIYINGVEQPTTGSVSFTASVTSDTSPQSVVIGADAFPSTISDEVIGLVDDLRVYNRELTDAEILRLYELGATAKIAKTLDTNPDLKNGLLVHYTFDGNLESVIADVSGNGNNAYASSSIAATSSIITAGRIGQGISLDGVDDEVVFSSFNPPHQGTVALWFYQNATGTVRQRIIGGDDRYEVTLSGTTNLMQNDLFAVSPGELEEPPIEAKRWYHAALTYDFDGTGNQAIYINGELSTSSNGTADGDPGGPFDLTIGFRTGATNPLQHFDGLVDDLRIYNRVLSADEISRIYGLGATTKIANTINTNPDLENGLVAHWGFDGTNVDITSNTAEIIDMSGNGYTGNWINHATTTAPGRMGQGIEFDGVDDYIEIAHNAALTPSDWTLSAWFKLDSITAEASQKIIVKRNNAADDTDYNMDVNQPEESFRCNYEDSEVFVTAEDTTKTVSTKEWHHGVCVYNSSTGKLRAYFDGVLMEEQDNGGTSPVNTTGDVRIGRYTSDQSEFDGIIDDVRLYNRPLSDAEVQRLYQLGQ